MTRLLAAYGEHLADNCGLAEATRYYRNRYALEFLEDRFRRKRLSVKGVSPRDILKFVRSYAKGHKRSSTQVMASSIRSFLRFLHMRGLCSERMFRAVPRIPQWKLSTIPRVLTSGQQTRFIGTFDRTTANGRRDYAMALCMLRLGLRVSEVVALNLRDIDWREKFIEIHSPKERRVRRLPLDGTVGRAIVTYLRRGRPQSNCPRLFLRHSVPVGTEATKTLVRAVIRTALSKSGAPEHLSGTHTLRHTAATRLYENGAALKEIADLLGHRSLETSTIYAKVNIPQLSAVALPWPEVRL